MRPEIVLDKSYLQGASPNDIQVLCTKFRVIMPGALFFEMLAGDPTERARCFAKLPPVMNPVEIVEHVGLLLHYEARKKRHIPSLSELRHEMLFEFNKRLREGTFVPLPEQLEGINEWRQELGAEVDSFRERVSITHNWFPGIASASNKERPEVIKNLKAAIASDKKMVRLLFAAIRKQSFPKWSQIDHRWAFYRWMQVHLLAAVDHIGRYGVGSDLAIARDLDNEVADFQYRIMGVLAGAIATRDRKCKEVFESLCPSGTLIE